MCGTTDDCQGVEPRMTVLPHEGTEKGPGVRELNCARTQAARPAGVRGLNCPHRRPAGVRDLN
eukprot:6141714-Alexandrium_andersonii.AAC.1